MWTPGQDWRCVNGLNKLYVQLRGYAPRSVPPATSANSWGSIADDAHAMTSDHYPHYYSALGSVAVVCARDFPHAPKLGMDGGVITEHMRHARDPRVGYIIFNRRITGPNHGWQWETYTGTDPHDTHFHVSSVHTTIADSLAEWSLPSLTAQSEPPPVRRTHMIMIAKTGEAEVYLAGPGGLWHIPSAAMRDQITAATGLKPLTVSQADFSGIVQVAQVPATSVAVDADQVAAALVADPQLGALLEAKAFEGSQRAESS
jgi:hypothetical protein